MDQDQTTRPPQPNQQPTEQPTEQPIAHPIEQPVDQSWEHGIESAAPPLDDQPASPAAPQLAAEPAASAQPEPSVVAPAPIATVVEQTVVVVPEGGKGLAITGFVLALVSVVLLIFWPVAILVSIAGLIISIIALAKHKPGKGLALAGVIIAPIALVLTLFLALITFATYNGIVERAKASEQKARELNQSSQQTQNN